MALTEGRVAKPEQQWGCLGSTPGRRVNNDEDRVKTRQFAIC